MRLWASDQAWLIPSILVTPGNTTAMHSVVRPAAHMCIDAPSKRHTTIQAMPSTIFYKGLPIQRIRNESRRYDTLQDVFVARPMINDLLLEQFLIRPTQSSDGNRKTSWRISWRVGKGPVETDHILHESFYRNWAHNTQHLHIIPFTRDGTSCPWKMR